MVIRNSALERETKPAMRGGDGEVLLARTPAAALAAHVRLLSEISIPPGASIGFHRHDGETEYFVITAGRGALDDDGSPAEVLPGDIVVTGPGSSHGIRNPGPGDLRMLALIVTEA